MKEMIRVLLIEPRRHPRLVEAEHTLENLQTMAGGHIAATYPWDDLVAVVFDDDGKFKGSEPNRMLEDYDLLAGRFFICGLSSDDFASISDELALKYAEKFWMPEAFLRTPEGLIVVRNDDGTEPDRAFLKRVHDLTDLIERSV